MQITMESLPIAVLIMILPHISFLNQIVIGDNTTRAEAVVMLGKLIK